MTSSVGRNSLIMASGTIASRVTGQIRTIFLVAALGTTGIAANAYQAGAQIPQVVFNLISTGIFNAVLVPQIVRTLKERDADERLSKLITLAIGLLLVITAVMMAGTPVLTSIYLDSSWTPAQRALANAFTFWCMPQILFYGLYTVIGQILAAKGHFGMYAWSSVGANVISCVGFAAFIMLFGSAGSQPLEFWTPDKIALTAGAWTAGVGFQAVVLFVPLLRSGIRYRPRFGLRGFGLRSMGKVAMWSIAMVVINQAMNIINTRVTTGAPAAGGDLDAIAGNASYQYAYTLYILPYSVIAASLATAVFPRIAAAISEQRVEDARLALSSALRSNSLAMLFFTAAMAAMPVPLIKALIPSASLDGARLIAPILLALLLGLLPTSAYLLAQRAFYAWEDGRSPFLFAALSNGVQVVMLLCFVFLLPPENWAMLVALALSLSYVICFPVVFWMLRRRFGGDLDDRRMAVMHAKTLVAALVAFGVGRVLCPWATRLVGADLGEGGQLNWPQALAICALVTLAVGAVYAGLLTALRVPEFTTLLDAVVGRARRLLHKRADVPQTASVQTGAAQTSSAQTDAEAPARPTPRVVSGHATEDMPPSIPPSTPQGQKAAFPAFTPAIPVTRMTADEYHREGAEGSMEPERDEVEGIPAPDMVEAEEEAQVAENANETAGEAIAEESAEAEAGDITSEDGGAEAEAEAEVAVATEVAAQEAQVLADQASAVDAASANDTVAPPSFAPRMQYRSPAGDVPQGTDEDADLSDEPLFGRFTTKAIAIAVGAVVLIVALVLAVISLNGGNTNPTTDNGTNWPDENVDEVPFGEEDDSNAAKTSATGEVSDITLIRTHNSARWLV